MNRRPVLAALGSGLVLAISGCLNAPGAEGGVLEVMHHDVPPDATVTDASDDRIADVEPLQRGLRGAHDGAGNADIDVSRREYDTVAQALSDLSWYDRSDNDSTHGTTYISGVYIRYDEEVYVVVLTPYCSDSVLLDARSDRGAYSWGGCIRRGDE